ncbi:Trp biosynthesis-associated membrane protein [Nocardioides euryhalodurans]|uniref:Trp biosynthesis protein n=1 Tax=Nocardioides euryhalodurans TaxID=2518370 RepID=A0A4P7GGB1_9ACTN|nr:Trp biosynthesis-associated membrane protein [Nocardioides euryhalodurans]QBR90880.1 hypothetical protein EXE57_00290 [Nocardioides euryhalodurans]
MAEPAAGRRRTFGPVVALGLAAGLLVSLAGNQAWVVDRSVPEGSDPLGQVSEAGEMPLALALGLVVLACWGVVLVTRRVVRRAVLVLACLVSLGLVAAVVSGYLTLPDQVLEAFPTGATRTDVGLTETTGWFWAAALGALASVVATVLAVAWCPAWPEMGSRYDAPGGRGVADVPLEEQSSIDLWKSMDEGRDPTA